ncbi:MAG: VCBS repeat-containing protein [Verrucomicrobia bacterium]|nr:VCBS repeat-containing protein [Verrucomicrobiota bacterium]
MEPSPKTPSTRSPWTRDIEPSLDASFVDYDRDGLLDIFVVNGQQESPCLYRQTSAGRFDKLSAAQVGSILVNPPESYNAAWADYDNDGWIDLFVADWQGRQPGVLYRNRGNRTFESLDVGSPIRDGGDSRAVLEILEKTLRENRKSAP